VESAPELRANERAIRRYSAEQREGIFADGSGCRDRRDGDGGEVDGVPVLRGVPGELDYVSGRMPSAVILKQSGGPARAQGLAQRAATAMVEFLPRAGAVIFTDDRGGAIEEMTRRMLLESKKP